MASQTKFIKGLHCIAQTLCVSVALFAPSAFALDIVEGTNKLQLASEIGKDYVIPLRLEGKTGAQAIERMLSEGFLCDVEPKSEIGLDEPPLLKCEKKPSGFGNLCEKLIVALRFKRSERVPSKLEMVQQLDAFKVHSALPFCPYTPEVSAEYLAQHKSAEAELAHQIDSLDLVGGARLAYEKLLLEGFYCGFAIDKASADSNESPKMICTKRPTGIKYCFESKVAMDVEWSPEVVTMKQLFGRLPASRVKAVRYSCEIPAIKNNSAPL